MWCIAFKAPTLLYCPQPLSPIAGPPPVPDLWASSVSENTDNCYSHHCTVF